MPFRLLSTAVVAAVLALGSPRIAEAVTIRDIVELTKAGLSDDIIVALIDADRTVFVLDAKQIVELRDAGVSEKVLLVMLESRQRYAQGTPSAEIPPPQPPISTQTERIVEVPVPVPVPVYLPSTPVIVAPRQYQSVFVEATTIQPGRFINDGYTRRTAPRETKSIWDRVSRGPQDIWRPRDPKPDPDKQDPPKQESPKQESSKSSAAKTPKSPR
jgi:hypothetical protein